MARYVEFLLVNQPGSARTNIAFGTSGGVPVEIVGGSIPAPSTMLVTIVDFADFGSVACPAGVPTPLLALTPVPGSKAYATHRFAVVNTGSNPVVVTAEPSSDGVHVDLDPDNVLSFTIPAGGALPLEVTGHPAAPYWGLQALSDLGTTVEFAWMAAQ